MIDRYTEAPEKSESARLEYRDALLSISQNGFSEYTEDKDAPELIQNFGAPLNLRIDFPCTVSQEYVGEDELCEIIRLRFMPLPNLPFYGLLFIPKGTDGKLPLVIASNGHLGTPELMYGMHGKNGYSDLTRRILRRNVAVFSPQFLLWNCGQSPAKPVYKTNYDRTEIDKKLKEVSGGINAIEIFCLLRSISALSKLRFLDMDKVAACGMSYGAFLTLRTMAISPAIKCGYFMSCTYGGRDMRWPEWFFRDISKTPRDSDFLSLCAPRPVFIEVGEKDDIFNLDDAEREYKIARSTYETCKMQEKLHFNIWNGAHIVNPSDEGVSFMINAIK